MGIYAEGNAENAEYFYPEMTDKTEAVKRVESDFCDFVKNTFLNGKNIYYVWEDDGEWVSALQLNLIGDDLYYLEALETAPNCRRKGYAARLLNEVIRDRFLISNGKFKICDCVSKTNVPSLKVHEKCGFKIVSENGHDYLQNKYDDKYYGLEYSFPTDKASQY